MRRMCVFCGSSPGARPEYLQAAREFGHALTRRGIGLVYGGARVGLMGEIARAVMADGGEVIGVIPRDLVERRVAFTDLADLRVVESMHERKALMVELSDAFVALPGGLGTIEELFEILTWAQLGIHQKPSGLLNVCHYFNGLMTFMDDVMNQQFMEPEHRSMILVDEDPEALLDKFAVYRPPQVDKAEWILKMSNNK